MKNRPITDRLQDRLWTLRVQRLAEEIPTEEKQMSSAGSVSGAMDWPQACAALADGHITSALFRRLRAVMEVVETLGPCDGRHHVRHIRATGHSEWLERPEVLALASWGHPLLWPRALLGTAHAMAPTSLRYLSHALWLRDEGIVGENSHVAEIGVGYGGLAAMNALVSQAHTTLVDLPDVERAAMMMLLENRLNHSATPASTAGIRTGFDCVISNYAFTELSTALQDRMLDSFISSSRHGMILSNARVFSRSIGGRSDQEILIALADHGIHARCHADHPLLSPSDRAYGNALIIW
jgi:hypothetical protein